MDGGESGGSTHFLPRKAAGALTDDLVPLRTRKLNIDALGKLLDLFHQLNPDGPHFWIVESRYAFHILPDSIRDENGQRTGARSLLDVSISVPEEPRTPSGHLIALCDAVGATSGVRMKFFGPNVDAQYAPNGLIPPRPQLLSLADEATQRLYAFPWGASAEPAREALISFLEGSATTLSWKLLCGPSDDPRKRSCVLNMAAMEITVAGPDRQPEKQPLEFDRCSRCPPLRAPRQAMPRARFRRGRSSSNSGRGAPRISPPRGSPTPAALPPRAPSASPGRRERARRPRLRYRLLPAGRGGSSRRGRISCGRRR